MQLPAFSALPYKLDAKSIEVAANSLLPPDCVECLSLSKVLACSVRLLLLEKDSPDAFCVLSSLCMLAPGESVTPYETPSRVARFCQQH